MKNFIQIERPVHQPRSLKERLQAGNLLLKAKRFITN
jgi:hypothetical protein